MHINGAAVAVILKAPHLVQQLVTGVDAVRVGGQTVQQFQLLGGSLHHLALDPQLIAVHVQTQVVEFDHALGALGSSRGGLAAAQHRLDAGHHFLGIKGLYHVIVCTQLQAQHLIKGLALGREHHHRGVARLADAAAHFQTVHLGHHHVQQHHIGLDLIELFQTFFAIVCHRDLIALLGQVQPQQLADIGIVVHNEDLFVGHNDLLPFYRMPAGAGRAAKYSTSYYTEEL